jgi:serine/threonine-protein kinase
MAPPIIDTLEVSTGGRDVPTLARSDLPVEGGAIAADVVPNELPSVPDVGEIIGGVYQVTAQAGKGGMGVVLAAIDLQLGRKVAIKVIQTNLSAAYSRSRFLVEARAMAEVNHPNVLPIYAFGQHGSAPYLVMEFLDSTLQQVIAENGANIDVDLALDLLDEICAGVQAMHDAETVHRDLKPANILLDANRHVRVADLGLAQKYQNGRSVREFVGTPGYIAPELFGEDEGRATASPPSDVYSLGCIAYELLTGRPPLESAFESELLSLHATAEIAPPSAKRRDLPKAFDQVILAALAKHPHRRTQCASQFGSDLRSARRKSQEPTRILVAEDEADFRDLLDLKLRMDFPETEVECVADGKAAVLSFDRRPASVVILDLQMPVIDGVAATVLLRARPEAAKVPIIVLTASGGPQDWKLLMSLGADRFLVKPIDLDDLVTLIRRTLKTRHASERS